MDKKQEIAELKALITSKWWELLEVELDKWIKDVEQIILRPDPKLDWVDIDTTFERNEVKFNYYDVMRLNLENIKSMKSLPKSLIKARWPWVFRGDIGIDNQ